MKKIIAVIILLTFPLEAFAESNPMLGKWTRNKDDCRSFVTEYAPDTFYHITPSYLVLTKRKKVGGDISYKINLPFVEFVWVQSMTRTIKWVSEYVLRFEGRNTMREVYYRHRKYFNGELNHEELEKEDGTIVNRHKSEGKWYRWPLRKGLETHYRCK